MSKIIYSCFCCSKIFKPKDRRHSKYCSFTCHVNYKISKKVFEYKECLECFKPIKISWENKENNFCSRSCGGTFHAKKRIASGYVMSDEQKEKISQGLKKNFLKNPRAVKSIVKETSTKIRKKIKIVGIYTKIYHNKCAHSGLIFLKRNKQKYHSLYSNLYTKESKAGYLFTFNVFDYPELFDVSLIEQHGFYNPVKNKNGMTRDHIISVNDAVKYGYDSYYIKHPLNCQLMSFKDNNIKKTRSDISYEELKKRVNDWEHSKLKK